MEKRLPDLVAERQVLIAAIAEQMALVGAGMPGQMVEVARLSARLTRVQLEIEDYDHD